MQYISYLSADTEIKTPIIIYNETANTIDPNLKINIQHFWPGENTAKRNTLFLSDLKKDKTPACDDTVDNTSG